MKQIKTNYLINSLFYGLIAIVFSLILDQWLFTFLNISQPFLNISIDLKIILTVILILIFYDYRLSALLLALGIVISLLFWMVSLNTLIDWFQLIQSFILEFRYSSYWILYETGLIQNMPSLTPYFIGLFSLVLSWLLVFVFANGFLSLLILVAPLFFIPNIVELSDWRWYLFLGLGLSLLIHFKAYSGSLRKAKTNFLMLLVFALSITSMTLGLSQILDENFFFNQSLYEYFSDESIINRSFIDPFSLHHAGYYGADRIIGGSVSISETSVMTIGVDNNKGSFYLRGPVYGQFRNNRWEYSSQAELLPFYNLRRDASNLDPFLSGAQAQAFNYNVLDSMKSEEILMIPHIYSMKMLFHPGIPFNISSNINDEKKFYFNAAGEVFSKESITESITINGQFSKTREILETINSNQISYFPRPNQTTYKPLLDKYDPQLSFWVYQSQDDLAMRIMNIIDHFKSNYEYSLTVQSIPRGKDFIETFLAEQKGYCVYYGSLLTLLLQDMGVKARYVEGYVVPSTSFSLDQNTNISLRRLSHASAHAWTEIFVEPYGWIILDATPSSHLSYLESYRSPHIPSDTPSDEDPTTPLPPNETEIEAPTQPIETKPDTSVPIETTPPTTSETLSNHLRQILWFTLLLVLSLGFVERFLSYKRRLDTDYLLAQNKYLATDLVKKIWLDMLRITNNHRDLSQPSLTVNQIFDIMIEQYAISDRNMVQKARNTLLQVLFNRPEQSDLELEDFLTFYRYLQRRSQRNTHPILHFIRRFIFGPHF